MKQNKLSLPDGCNLRQATSQDLRLIRWMVFRAKLDPTQLRWQQFWLIECDQQIVACGQLRNFLGVQELGSLVVSPDWRGRGLGSILTQHLIQQATQPLYLECLGQGLARFYTHFGFVPVSFQELPIALKQKFRLSQIGKKLIGVPVMFMKYQR